MTISKSITDYVKSWTGYKGCACEKDWLCPVCDLKQLVERLKVFERIPSE